MYKRIREISINKGFITTSINIENAATLCNKQLTELPSTLYKSIDFKTTSAIIGCLFCEELAKECNAIPNPIEKGHPDIVPREASKATEEQLRNYPKGIEIKTTIGNIEKGAALRAGQIRIDHLTGITWQAHHQEVRELMGLTWDFANEYKGGNYPCITGIFFSDNLNSSDWGAVSGTSGRNTKVSGMRSSGKEKMGGGAILILDNPKYLEKYTRLLKIPKV